ncbi:MAG: hypothetical protein EHM70_23340, partial [Chloroflexota bacterium]
MLSNRKSKLLGINIVLILAVLSGMLFLGTRVSAQSPASASAGQASQVGQGSNGYIYQVREIETTELGVPNPAGLIYSAPGNLLQV